MNSEIKVKETDGKPHQKKKKKKQYNNVTINDIKVKRKCTKKQITSKTF